MSGNEPAMRLPMFQRYGYDKWHAEFHFQGYHLLHLTPEVGRYIRGRPEVRRELISHLDEAELHWPMWFLSQGSAFTRDYGESHALSPIFSAMIFPARALVQPAQAKELRMWVDAEDAPRGDLFYLERLVLAIEAMGKETWVDVRR
jgi:hypothetical protein